MEKTITIDNKEVRLKASASFALRYKAQFNKDILKTLLPLVDKLLPLFQQLNGQELDIKTLNEGQLRMVLDACSMVEMEDIYNVIWTLAKTADKDIPEPILWLDDFDKFPLTDILPVAGELLLPSLFSTKESKKK